MSEVDLSEILVKLQGIQSVTDDMIGHLELIINDRSYGLEPRISQKEIKNLLHLLEDFNGDCIENHYFKIYKKIIEIQSDGHVITFSKE